MTSMPQHGPGEDRIGAARACLAEVSQSWSEWTRIRRPCGSASRIEDEM